MLTKQPIIYLDFDGVLNREGTATMAEGPAKDHPALQWVIRLSRGKAMGLDPTLVKRVYRFAVQHRADVVLSTSWRKMGLDACKEILSLHGWESVDNIIDETPTKMSLYSRAGEISLDLRDRSDVGPYVILDDDAALSRSENPVIKDHLVLTEESVGITVDDLKKAHQILCGSVPN
jgi:hypothetical protein